MEARNAAHATFPFHHLLFFPSLLVWIFRHRNLRIRYSPSDNLRTLGYRVDGIHGSNCSAFQILVKLQFFVNMVEGYRSSFSKGLGSVGIGGLATFFSEIFGIFFRGDKSEGDLDRKCRDRRTIGGEKGRGGGNGLVCFPLASIFPSDRKTSSREAPGWGRLPNNKERPLMLLPMLLMLDSRRSKDFCDPRDVTARPVSCALQRVDILREASLRLRSRTSRRLCDPRIVVGIGGLVEELEARRKLSPDAVRELVAVLSRPRRS